MALFPQFPMLQRLSASLNQLGWRDSAWLAVARLLERVPGGRCALHRYQFVAQAVAPGGYIYLEAPKAWNDEALLPFGLGLRRHLKAGAVHAHLLVRLG